MATDDTGGVNRRTVLKTTAAAAGGGLAATGTAAAVCTEVRLTADYKLNETSSDPDSCVGDAVGPVLEAGTELPVYDRCEDDNGTYYQVECGGGWVSDFRTECIRTSWRHPPCLSG